MQNANDKQYLNRVFLPTTIDVEASASAGKLVLSYARDDAGKQALVAELSDMGIVFNHETKSFLIGNSGISYGSKPGVEKAPADTKETTAFSFTKVEGASCVTRKTEIRGDGRRVPLTTKLANVSLELTDISVGSIGGVAYCWIGLEPNRDVHPEWMEIKKQKRARWNERSVKTKRGAGLGDIENIS